MKKIKGLKSFNALEGKALKELHSTNITGGIAAEKVNIIQSNFTDEWGCPDYDFYYDGIYGHRTFTCREL